MVHLTIVFYIPKVDETSLGEEQEVATRGHGVSVNLRLDVDHGSGIGLQPGDVDLNVKVADTKMHVSFRTG